MTEEFLQYIWKHALFDRLLLKTTDGNRVEIIHAGLHNSDAGPDFFNAKLRIGDTLWAGNVEVHVKSSEWMKHKHQNDAAYKNVILHVVWENDAIITLPGGFPLPALELKNVVIPDVYRKYEELKSSSKRIPCENEISNVTQFTLHSWLDRLVSERLERKTKLVDSTLDKSIHDWEETFYRLILRTLGNPLNSDAFEHLAETLPFRVVNKHKSDILQLEALLLGQAGFLNEKFKDGYSIRLQKEYEYLKYKLNLAPMSKSEWRFMRIRQPQFPTIRLAQLASIINKEEHLFRKAMEAETIDDIVKLFSIVPSDYWHTHIQPDKLAVRKVGAIGKSTIEILIINAIVPVMFVYGRYTGKEETAERALDLLHTLKPENNTFIKKWDSIGVSSADAYESQALLQLRKEYCDKRRCVNCAIGHELMNVK